MAATAHVPSHRKALALPAAVCMYVCCISLAQQPAVCRMNRIERSRGPPLRMRYPEIDFRLQLSADAARAFEVRRSLYRSQPVCFEPSRFEFLVPARAYGSALASIV